MPASPAAAQGVAFANDHVAQIFWHYPERIDDCLGFAVYREEDGKADVALPAWVGFPGEQSGTAWQARDTSVWPVQKMDWRDLAAESGKTYRYKIVPMLGEPGDLRPAENLAVTTPPVTLTGDFGKFMLASPTQPLSSQGFAHSDLVPKKDDGDIDSEALVERLRTPGDELRTRMVGDVVKTLTALPDRCINEGGTLYGALYELDDPELVDKLLEVPRLHLILSNTGPDDKTNAEARQKLHAMAKRRGKDWEIIDRMLPNGHIGHNKSLIYVDRQGKPQAALVGSTNWTSLAITAQSNSALVVNEPRLAAAMLKNWTDIRTDTLSGYKFPLQGPALRQANAESFSFSARDLDYTVWFSPNTKAHNKTSASPVPEDLQAVFDAMGTAREGILFLAFQPGTPSILDRAVELGQENPQILIRGAVTDGKAASQVTTLLHRNGEKLVDIVGAAAEKEPVGNRVKELLKASPSAHAIIHDKVVVVDPFSDSPTVIIGSHNLGARASYNNDETFVIMKGPGAAPLAQALGTHILDVYDHYRTRWAMGKGQERPLALDTDDGWQNKYFDRRNAASHDSQLWSHAAVLAPAKPAPAAEAEADEPEMEPAAARRA